MSQVMTGQQLRAAVAGRMPERDLQENVRRAAVWRARPWTYYHTHRAQHSPAGFPDCFLWRYEGDPGNPRLRIVVAELKRVGETPSAAQEHWLQMFRWLSFAMKSLWRRAGEQPPCALEVYVWTPVEWMDGSIHEVLR